MKTYTIINPLNNNYVYYYVGQIVQSADTCQVFTERKEAEDMATYMIKEMILMKKKSIDGIAFFPKVVTNYFKTNNYRNDQNNNS